MSTAEQTAADPATEPPVAAEPDRAPETALPAEPDRAEPDRAAELGAPTEPGARRRGRPKGSAARTTRTVELMLTVSGSADGDWQADLKQGSSWLTRGLPVTAAAVLRAAQELHPEIAGPIDGVIGAAREQRASRVAALEAELAQARKALAEMEE